MPDPTPPEYRALQDNLVLCVIKEAEQRQYRDRLVATWRDVLHSALQMTDNVSGIQMVHAVISNMDEYLKRTKA